MTQETIEQQIETLQNRAKALQTIRDLLEADPELAPQLRQLLAGYVPDRPLMIQKGSNTDAIVDALQKNKGKPLTIAELVEKTGRSKGAIRQVLYRVQKHKFRQHPMYQGRETGFTIKAAPKK